MRNEVNPFEKSTGSDKLGSNKSLLLIFLAVLFAAWVIGNNGIVGGIGLIAIPFVLIFGYFFFKNPIIGVYTAVALSFLILGSARYIKGVQVGMAMDGILFLTYIALFFNRFKERINWAPANKDATILAAVWFFFTVLQFFNPEARSKEAWFVGFRGISLYMMLLIPLVLLMIDTRRKLDIFLYLWAGFSFLVTAKGIMQLTIGVDPFEKAWLDAGGAVTHILFGKLRIFSFLSDAGQFGANQAYSGVVFAIIGFTVKDRKIKIFYLTVAALGLYGMLLSGTRGAISIPLTGFFLYAVLRKNRFVMIAGTVSLLLVFIFFKYTTIGQDNQQIRRMRSAFDPNDASLQVRLENQKKLSVYLSTRPFGGGIGHAGVKAQRFLPNAFLSNVATDSWYVLIWAEMGVVGLLLHLFILFYVLGKSAWMIMFKLKDPEIKIIMSAMASGMFGIMVASYGNAVLGTMPTGILIYTCMAIMLNAKHFDEEATNARPLEVSKA
ncbi:MAG: O-antigen ligase family protein [Bacteroidetes bacterium]|nr:O-antigen ligase family protein [Bacteroidota bacterium]